MNFTFKYYNKGDEIYRGSSNKYQEIQNIMWFTPDIKSASIYGYVYKYIIKSPVKLLSMDDPDNILNLGILATQNNKSDVYHALNRSFKLISNNKKIIRNSESEDDRLILSFICKMGFEGFSSNSISKSEENNDSKFHPELAICNSKKYVEQIELVNQDSYNPGLLAHSLSLKESRKKEKRIEPLDVQYGRKLFFD